MADHTAGDPCSSLKWKRKSLRQVSGALGAKHPASAPTVARLLRTRDYSLKVNHKQLTVSSPHRNEQFLYLQAQKEAFLQRGWPVIYVDTKKRELIGLFKQAGAIWCRDPHRVNVYDFRSQAKGIAIPYGIYDATRNAGFVYVGTTCDTSEFAVAAIRWRWEQWVSISPVEVCTPARLGQCDRLECHGVSLSHRRFEMELGRASAIRSDQSELGGRALEHVSQDAPVSRSHDHREGLAREIPTDEKEICDRP